jgi:hypothetical protein
MAATRVRLAYRFQRKATLGGERVECRFRWKPTFDVP